MESSERPAPATGAITGYLDAFRSAGLPLVVGEFGDRHKQPGRRRGRHSRAASSPAFQPVPVPISNTRMPSCNGSLSTLPATKSP